MFSISIKPVPVRLGDEGQVSRLPGEGFNAFLSKPIDPATFADEVHRLIERESKKKGG